MVWNPVDQRQPVRVDPPCPKAKRCIIELTAIQFSCRGVGLRKIGFVVPKKRGWKALVLYRRIIACGFSNEGGVSAVQCGSPDQ